MTTSSDVKEPPTVRMVSGYTTNASGVLAAAEDAYCLGKKTVGNYVPETVSTYATHLESTVAPYGVQAEAQLKSLAGRLDDMIVDKAVDYAVEVGQTAQVKAQHTVDTVVTRALDARAAVASAPVKVFEAAESIRTTVEVQATERANKVMEKPVVKDLLIPASKAVASGVLGASDIVVDYVLPGGESENEEEVEGVLPHATRIVHKVTSRSTKAASVAKDAVVANLKARRDSVVKTVEGVLPKGAVESVKAEWATTDGKPSSERVSTLLHSVVTNYRKRITVTSSNYVKPYVVAVTDYGEYFLERVHDFESPENDSKPETEAAQEKAMKSILDRISQKFVEPAFVRVVAVLYVVNDEVQRFRVEKFEPAIASIKKVVKDSATAGATATSQYRQRMSDHLRLRAGTIIDEFLARAKDVGEPVAIAARDLNKISIDVWSKLEKVRDGNVTFSEFRTEFEKSLRTKGVQLQSRIEPYTARAYVAIQESFVAMHILKVQTHYVALKEATYTSYLRIVSENDGLGTVSLKALRSAVASRMGDEFLSETMDPVLNRMYLATQVAGASVSEAFDSVQNLLKSDEVVEDIVEEEENVDESFVEGDPIDDENEEYFDSDGKFE